MAAPKKPASKPIAKPARTAVPEAAPMQSIPAAPVAQSVVKSEVKGSGTSAKAPSARALTRDEIAKRAYQIYANRGYTPGSPDEDWHEAERQLRAGL